MLTRDDALAIASVLYDLAADLKKAPAPGEFADRTYRLAQLIETSQHQPTTPIHYEELHMIPSTTRGPRHRATPTITQRLQILARRLRSALPRLRTYHAATASEQ